MGGGECVCACVGGWVGGRAKRTGTHLPIYSCTSALDTGAFDHDEDVSPPGPPPPDLPSTNGFDYDLLSKLHFQNIFFGVRRWDASGVVPSSTAVPSTKTWQARMWVRVDWSCFSNLPSTLYYILTKLCGTFSNINIWQGHYTQMDAIVGIDTTKSLNHTMQVFVQNATRQFGPGCSTKNVLIIEPNYPIFIKVEQFYCYNEHCPKVV